MRKSTLAATLALCAAAAFAGDKVTTQTADNADFSVCKTYQWAKTSQEISNPITNENVIGWINAELSDKGWTKSADGSCYVSYQVAVQQQRGANWSGMGGRWMGGMGNIQTYTIEDGELVVSVFGPNKEMLWMGSAKGTVNSDVNKESKDLKNDIHKMFEKLPGQ